MYSDPIEPISETVLSLGEWTVYLTVDAKDRLFPSFGKTLRDGCGGIEARKKGKNQLHIRSLYPAPKQELKEKPFVIGDWLVGLKVTATDEFFLTFTHQEKETEISSPKKTLGIDFCIEAV